MYSRFLHISLTPFHKGAANRLFCNSVLLVASYQKRRFLSIWGVFRECPAAPVPLDKTGFFSIMDIEGRCY